nr:hotdog domain-containing protein [Nocardioides sp. zg-DK7169]
MFGDVATEMCIRTDGDEGLFAGYAEVWFLAPVRAGDVVEASAELVAVGSRSRTLELALHVVARGCGSTEQPGAAQLLAEPILATTARGTVVVPGTRREG